MRPRSAIGPALTLAALVLPACGPARTSVTLRLDDGAAPVARAQVRAVALGLSPVPLPVSLESLSQSAAQTGVVALSDDRGLVTLSLYAGRSHLIEVLPPADGPPPEQPRLWRWYLDEHARDLREPFRADERNPPGMRAALVR
ncbi:MAG: hypothetical protein IBJ11_11770 [Phycisphaerales bacterium]|nr:hypothetical protein [Phycisphaerales bacterium]